jgi:hypothetical protein
VIGCGACNQQKTEEKEEEEEEEEEEGVECGGLYMDSGG